MAKKPAKNTTASKGKELENVEFEPREGMDERLAQDHANASNYYREMAKREAAAREEMED